MLNVDARVQPPLPSFSELKHQKVVEPRGKVLTPNFSVKVDRIGKVEKL